MKTMKKASLWSLLVIACIVLAACWGRSTATPTPQPIATDAGAAALPATATAQPEPASGGEGGPLPEETSSIATVEPTLAAIAQITSTTTVTPTAAPPTMTLPATAAPVSPTVTTALTATTWSTDPHPLQIEVMRQQTYPGSAITFEETLAPGDNYSRYRVSYQSDGFKIYALMTVPTDPKPVTGWPVIIFNHGYIPPAQYRTTERYVAYVDAIARSGYIVFKLDYRGHGSSEGTASGGYGSPDYTVDALNALASLKAYPDADPNRIGMWGHSMGGQVTLRAMVVAKEIKAGVIWGGVVASYPDIISRWHHPATADHVPSNHRGWRQEITDKYGTPEQNPAFWASISPNSYLADISGPLQLHHSTADAEVPLLFSDLLYAEAQAAGEEIEYYTYKGDNHNISANFTEAMQRSIAFFDKYVKGL